MAALTPEIEVRRSARRKRTVTAFREGDRIVVVVPARLGATSEREWVDKMVASVLERERRSGRRGARRSDEALQTRARELARTYLDGAMPSSVQWVGTMTTRWASCTPVDRTIRVSDRLREAPSWVVDYVLVHELAHLLVPGHGPDFWAWVQRYPRTERARGYLDGLAAGARLGSDWRGLDDDDADGDDADGDDADGEHRGRDDRGGVDHDGDELPSSG